MSEGIRLQELQNLPTHWRVVLQTLMRRPMTYAALRETVAQLPDDSRITDVQLDAAIAELRRRGWLLEDNDAPETLLRANIARKPGRQLAQRIWDALDDSGSAAEADEPLRRGGSRTLPAELWDSLEKTTPAEEDTQPAQKRKLSPNLWDKLDDPDETASAKPDEPPPDPDETTPAKKPRKSLFDALDE